MVPNKNKISVAIQVLPTTTYSHPYEVIDKIIQLIASKGFNYMVCPFETVVECTLNEALLLIYEIHNECYKYDTQSVLINIKIHSIKNTDALMEHKISKYR
ncbi:MAG: thiamine-binding protein [Bacteroidales bacterium]|nr:thiamine-binding protein [Bacteroidales bacterium]